MNRDFLARLLKKYTAEECSEEERQLVDAWYQRLGELPKGAEATQEELDVIESRIWRNIQPSGGEGVTRKDRVFRMPAIDNAGRWVAAASIVIAVVLCVSLFHRRGGEEKDNAVYVAAQLRSGMLERTNDALAEMSLHLEDGTEVVLRPGSKLVYPANFSADKRVVFLDGEGFFDVSRNDKKPFFVLTKATVTKVLGTSFIVKTQKGRVIVRVRTGKVAVFENNSNKQGPSPAGDSGVVVTPNQQTVFNPERHGFETALVDKPVLIPSRPAESFVFKDCPLETVLSRIGDAYDIKIAAASDKLRHCPFTGDISDTTLSLYQKLEIIGVSLNAAYEVRKTEIVFTGSGCK